MIKKFRAKPATQYDFEAIEVQDDAVKNITKFCSFAKINHTVGEYDTEIKPQFVCVQIGELWAKPFDYICKSDNGYFVMFAEEIRNNYEELK